MYVFEFASGGATTADCTDWVVPFATAGDPVEFADVSGDLGGVVTDIPTFESDCTDWVVPF